LEKLFIRFDLSSDISLKTLEDLTFNIIFLDPVRARVSLSLNGAGKPAKYFIKDDSGEREMPLSDAVYDKIIEIAVPFELLNLAQNYENIEFCVSVDKNSLEIERWPYQASLIIPKPSEGFNFLSWSV
jgi:hypothetical protein